MIPGAYSTHFREIDQDHIKQLREAHGEERNVLKGRGKLLQNETNKRRRAQLLKRKIEQQKEEKRRNAILAKRREQIREVTEKYQRQNKNYSPQDYEDRHPPYHSSTPTLEDALSAVRGAEAAAVRVRLRASSESNLAGSPVKSLAGSGHGSMRVVWDDCGIRRLRATSAGSVRPTSGVHPNHPSHHDNHVAMDTTSGGPCLDAPVYQTRGPGSQTWGASVEVQRRDTDTQKALLRDDSLRNLSNSRSLFEHQLAHQQLLLVEEQRKSLHQFNQAIREEMDGDAKLNGMEDIDGAPESSLPDPMGNGQFRRDSSDSVDSLDNTKPSYDQEHQPGGAAQATHISNGNRLPGSIPSDVTSAYSAADNNYNPSIYTSASAAQPLYAASAPGVNEAQALTSDVTTQSFLLHRAPSATGSGSNIAVVQPSVVHKPPAAPLASGNQTGSAPQQQVGLANGSRKEVGWVENMTSTEKQLYAGRNPTNITGGSQQGAFAASSPLICQNTAVESGMLGTGDVIKDYTGFSQKPTAQKSDATNGEMGKSASKNVTASGTPTAHDSRVVNTQAWATPSPVGDNRGAVRSAQAHPVPASTMAPIVAGSSTKATPVLDRKPPIQHTAADLTDSSGRSYTWQAVPVSNGNTTSDKSRGAQDPRPVRRTQSGAPSVGWSPEEDRSSESSQTSDGVAKESEPIIKSILKKSSSFSGSINVVGRKNGPSAARAGGHARAVVRRSQSARASVRDSLEITKQRTDDKTKNGKKSVRFADLTYEEEGESDESAEAASPPSAQQQQPPQAQKPPRYQPHPPQSNIPCPIPASGIASATRPTRPASAKFAIPSNPENVSPSKIPRAASAGTASRGPFMRPPHPPSHPPTARAALNNHYLGNQRQVTQRVEDRAAASNQTAPSSHVTGAETSAAVRKSSDGVYGANGLRLDRTPTDDEINWLWDKVRTCLSRPAPSSSMVTQNGDGSLATGSRPSANMSQKFIDGSSLAPQHRVTTRTNSGLPTGNYTNAPPNAASKPVAMTAPAKQKVTMDTLNNYSRKAGLLNQRKSGNPGNGEGVISYPGAAVQSHVQRVGGGQGPLHSTAEPSPSYRHQPDGRGNHAPVTESLAAFVTAEDLAKKSASESEIEQAMEQTWRRQHAYNTAQPRDKAPSTISIEEQRLMQSLERLNDRLRLTETNMYPSTAHAPKPPSHAPDADSTSVQDQSSSHGYGGFKGTKPLSASRRHVTNTGTVPRHQFRVRSAGAAQHTGYGTQYRYR